MNILVFNSSLRVGGAESMSVALANALANQGVSVSFAAANGPLRDNLDRRVEYFPVENTNASFTHGAHDLARVIREKQPDIVHSHGGTCALAAAVAVKSGKTPCMRVLTHHSRMFRRAPRFISGPVLKRCADHFIAISRFKAADLEKLHIPAEKISLIPNFIDVDSVATRVASADRAATRRELGIPDGARVLMMAGRVLPAKRFDQFVRIAAETARRYRQAPVHALIVGDGPELDSVREVAKKEGRPAVVHAPGFQRDVVRYFAIADCVVFPSEHPEVLPMFLIEASAAGVPVVCSDIPGNREIITDGETGRVVRGDIATWGDTVNDILSDSKRAEKLAANAQRNAVDRFDSRQAAREMIQTYQSLLATRAK